MKNSLSILAVLGILAISSSAWAETETGIEKEALVPWFDYGLGGSYRVSSNAVGRIRADADGKSIKQESIVQRVSFTPHLSFGKRLELHSDFQLAAGQLNYEGVPEEFRGGGLPYGENSAFSEGMSKQVQLRKLFLKWTTPIGALIVGRTGSHWGLGMMANSGDDIAREWGDTIFGDDRGYGDLVSRVAFATKPMLFFSQSDFAQKLIFVIGADKVRRDDHIRDAMGDEAYQGLGALKYMDGTNELGMYMAYRDLQDRNGAELQAWACDIAGKGDRRFGDILLYGKGELAYVTGNTNIAANYAHRDSLDVKQLGYVGQVGLSYTPWGAAADIETGYASGDSNPYDGNVRNFSFDPNYNPSLLLFEYVRTAETIAAAANASDPERVAAPPQAIRFLPSQGSVSNTVYVRPTARYSLGEFGARLAVMWAWSEEDLIDPYNTTMESEATNFQGGSASNRFLGTEVNVGFDYSFRWEKWVAGTLTLQAGRLQPGNAFMNHSGAIAKGVNRVFGSIQFQWLPEPT